MRTTSPVFLAVSFLTNDIQASLSPVHHGLSSTSRTETVRHTNVPRPLAAVSLPPDVIDEIRGRKWDTCESDVVNSLGICAGVLHNFIGATGRWLPFYL